MRPVSLAFLATLLVVGVALAPAPAQTSAKGPALMEGAIAALEACQPYAMLPADRYGEWKVIDMSFTPQDFSG